VEEELRERRTHEAAARARTQAASQPPRSSPGAPPFAGGTR
jgi:hypothetical protein